MTALGVAEALEVVLDETAEPVEDTKLLDAEPLDVEPEPVADIVALFEELPVLEIVEEAEGVTSLAPQIQGALTAAPTLLLR